MHIVVVPILLGRGVRLWDGLEGLENDYDVEATSSPSGVTHVTFTRAGVLNRFGRGPRARPRGQLLPAPEGPVTPIDRTQGERHDR
jgi:hypothetical protein